jgi:hypothetical protein
MVNFYSPVRMPRDAFELLIARVDEAVGRQSVALVLNEDFPLRALDPVSQDAVDFKDIASDEDLSDIVNYLDQLLYFAFEFAPKEIVDSFVRDYNENASDNEKSDAFSRVEFIRENMPNLRDIWRDKGNTVMPVLTGFSYESAPRGEFRCANLYLSASRIEPNGSPDKTDAVRLRVQVWPADVRILVRELEHLLSHLIVDDDGVEGEGDAENSVED